MNEQVGLNHASVYTRHLVGNALNYALGMIEKPGITGIDSEGRLRCMRDQTGGDQPVWNPVGDAEFARQRADQDRIVLVPERGPDFSKAPGAKPTPVEDHQVVNKLTRRFVEAHFGVERARRAALTLNDHETSNGRPAVYVVEPIVIPARVGAKFGAYHLDTDPQDVQVFYGETAEEALLRAFVGGRLGAEVTVPREIIKQCAEPELRRRVDAIPTVPAQSTGHLVTMARAWGRALARAGGDANRVNWAGEDAQTIRDLAEAGEPINVKQLAAQLEAHSPAAAALDVRYEIGSMVRRIVESVKQKSGDYWYHHRSELECEQVFHSSEGLVKLDRNVPGDGTKWYVASWSGTGWSYEDGTIEPGDLHGDPIQGVDWKNPDAVRELVARGERATADAAPSP